MGSEIVLSVGNFEIDWGKNNIFSNHSKLFLPSEKRDCAYHYADNISERKPAYCKKLIDAKGRLELLGYSLHNAKLKYEQSHLIEERHKPLPFSSFTRIIQSVDISKFRKPTDIYDDWDLGEFVVKEIFDNPAFKQFPELRNIDRDNGEFYENLDPYIVLRLLIENKRNHNRHLAWRYYDVAENGWVAESNIYERLDRSEKYLLVTEGTSDSFIVKKSIQLLRPDIADFFYFVDMEENYPFTGTGNLFRFCQGLTSIDLQNKVIVILDNDVEGCKTYDKISKLSLPRNMRIIKLPEMKPFEKFTSIGPAGIERKNINGRASSIECFLDLKYLIRSQPKIRWKSFDEERNDYQGALENKDAYVRVFKNVNSTSRYDFTKLNALLDRIYNAAIEIA